tara:strand:+ start:449 stop:1279 length:831 start_codon:yes stop_codon:yes gene_type:complete
MKNFVIISFLAFLMIFTAFFLFSVDSDNVPVISVDPIEKYPHDKKAFTQGFEFHKGTFFEGTGLRGASNLREVNIFTGKVLRSIQLPPEFFGEGITIINGKIYQLTWKSGKAFQYDLENFELIREFGINGEGWGLTNDGNNLIMSNGTDKIVFLDPRSFKLVRTLSVTKNGKPQNLLNELEFIKGDIWANVWKTDDILRINSKTGQVKSVLDLSNISERKHVDDVANGIAWDKEKDIVYVTGKLWSNVYKLNLNKGKVINRSLIQTWFNSKKHLLR